MEMTLKCENDGTHINPLVFGHVNGMSRNSMARNLESWLMGLTLVGVGNTQKGRRRIHTTTVSAGGTSMFFRLWIWCHDAPPLWD